jgi:hypothetical protein
MVRGGTGLVTVASLLGYARLQNVRACAEPAGAGRIKASEHLTADGSSQAAGQNRPRVGLVPEPLTSPRF